MNELQQAIDIVPGLRQEWMALARRRRLILTITVLSLVVAALFNFSVRPMYDAGAVVSAAESIPNQPFARLNTDPARLGAVIDKEIARITSRELATKVINAAGPLIKAELSQGPTNSWRQRLRWSEKSETGDAPLDIPSAVAALRSRLRVQWREPSSWIDIRVIGYDPKAAAEIANAVLNTYVAETAAANQQSLDTARGTFESQLNKKEKRLGEQLTELRTTGTQAGVGDIAARKAILERQIRGFQEALVAAQTARVGRAATLRDAAQPTGAALTATADARMLAAESRVADLEDQERGLLATLGAKHPDVIAVQEQLQGARARLQSVTVSVQQAGAAAYQLALKEEARIEDRLQRVQEQLSRLESESFDYTMDQKKADASRLGVEQLLRTQETSVAIIIATEIIQSATPSPAPSFPQKQQNFAYALGGGLALGIFLAMFLERFDDSVQTPDDIKDVLGLTFLGMVPLVSRDPLQNIVSAVGDGRSGFADGLRVIRTNLMYGQAEKRPKVLVFTSASPGDGKSTVASGVALLLHETQASVLLIDGDLRRPSIHSLFEVPQGPGLSDLLALSTPLALRTTSRAGIDIIPAGPPLTVSAARLGSENMRTVLALARKKYDWVIIDSPPSLGLPDASVLATLADAAVVVCSGDKTPRQALRAVSDQLRSVGAPMLGVVLNRVDMNRHSYYYGRYYSKYYGPDNAKTRG